MYEMKNGWRIVDEFLSHGIRCFIAKWKRGELPDKAWADIGEAGFYQYNGYCVVPSCHSLRGVVDKYTYECLKTHLKTPNTIWRYKEGNPKEYNVHGGVTYRDWGYGGMRQYPVTEWIIGFDTGHLGDNEVDQYGGYKKEEPYVKCECMRLAEQIAEDV